MKLELALTLRPFILTLGLELTKRGLFLTWSAFDATERKAEFYRPADRLWKVAK